MDARRFETLYRAFVRRKTVEELEERKLAITAALYANSNWDDKDSPRDQVIEGLEESTQDAIAKVYGMVPTIEEEFEIDPNDPFWSAMYRGLKKQHGSEKPTPEEIEKAKEASQTESGQEYDIDQN